MRTKTKRKYYNFLRFKRDFQRYSVGKVRSYELILHWVKSKISRNQFLTLSGILVGCTAGFAAVLLKTIVHTIHYFITEQIHFKVQLLFYLLLPTLGIILTTLVVIYVFNRQDRKGIGAILYEIAQRSSVVSSVKMYSQVVQSSITVGFGGSVGLESPIAVTGAAIGSNYAQTYKLGYRERTLLLAAGATAGIASAFNAPIAGMMFAFEILLTGVVFSDFIPLVVAAVCGSLISRIFLQEDILFRFYARESFDYHNTFYYLLLGVFTGLYARYFVVVSQAVEHFFHRLKCSRLWKAALGGLLLSLLCLLLPPLFGEGYDTVRALNNGNVEGIVQSSFFRYFEFQDWYVIVFLAMVCLMKAFATSITIFSGGNGGNFAPALFAGGTLGFLFATLCNVVGFLDVPVTNLVLVGMAGVMSGVLYAPLTAIFLIAESSSGYDLFIPLMIVSVTSFLIGKWFSGISPELKKMADEGKIFTRAHDKNMLSLLHISDLVNKDVQIIKQGSSAQELMDVIKNGRKNMFAVLNEEHHLVGVFTLDDIRPFLFDITLQGSLDLEQVLKAPVALIRLDDEMTKVVKIFDETGAWHLPVLGNQDQFLGFVSKSAVLTSYRQLLKDYS